MARSKELILVAGKPGSGKTTAAKTASEILGDTYYFSIGDELRAIGLEGRPSRLSAEIAQYTDELRNHLPLPAHLAHLVLEECVLSSSDTLIIVDGYPQYQDRLPAFEATLGGLSARVLVVCEIDVNDDIARSRLRNRKDRIEDLTEDAAFIDKRLVGYQRNAIPTIEQLAQQYPLRKVDGLSSRQEVANKLVQTITEYL
jgi:adenylate kinase family enzyme